MILFSLQDSLVFFLSQCNARFRSYLLLVFMWFQKERNSFKISKRYTATHTWNKISTKCELIHKNNLSTVLLSDQNKTRAREVPKSKSIAANTYLSAKRRKALLISCSEALRPTPSTSYGSLLCAAAPAAAAESPFSALKDPNLGPAMLTGPPDGTSHLPPQKA